MFRVCTLNMYDDWSLGHARIEPTVTCLPHACVDGKSMWPFSHAIYCSIVEQSEDTPSIQLTQGTQFHQVLVGNLCLNDAEEDAVVAYMETH